MRAWMGSLAVGCLLAACLAGCNRPEGPASANRQAQNVLGAVAVIDLDAVAQKLGRDKAMSEAIQQHQAALNQQLANIKVSYEKEISAETEPVRPIPFPGASPNSSRPWAARPAPT